MVELVEMHEPVRSGAGFDELGEGFLGRERRRFRRGNFIDWRWILLALNRGAKARFRRLKGDAAAIGRTRRGDGVGRDRHRHD